MFKEVGRKTIAQHPSLVRSLHIMVLDRHISLLQIVIDHRTEISPDCARALPCEPLVFTGALRPTEPHETVGLRPPCLIPLSLSQDVRRLVVCTFT
jgi:hypothetical protein